VRWYPGFSLECFAEGGQHVLAMFGCGGEVSADCVAVLGAVFAGEAPGDVLLDFGWAQVAFAWLEVGGTLRSWAKRRTSA
jgi:hypothetical protein